MACATSNFLILWMHKKNKKKSPILYVLRFTVDHILLALTARPRKEKNNL